MINRGKLIPRSSKSNTVKSNSVSDLYVIKGAAIKVDNILKERLVLSKVREGILRQEEERRIRSGREMLLEKDEKNNYNVEDTDKVQKKKSGLGGLLGTVFRGILGSLGSVAFGLTPSLLGVGLVLKKLTNPFLLITGVAFTALNVIVSKSGSQFKELNRKVNKDDISAGKIERGARDVVDSLLTAVSLYASGSVVGAGARGLIGGERFTKKGALLQLEKDAEAGVNVRKQFVKLKKGKKLTAAQAAQRDFDLDPNFALEDALRFNERRGGFRPKLDFNKFTPEENFLRITNPFLFENITKPSRKRVKGKTLDDITEPKKTRARPKKINPEVLDLLRTQQEARDVKAAAKTKRLKIENILDQFEDVDFDDPELLKLDAEMKAMRKPKPPRFTTSPRTRRALAGQQLGLTRRFQRGMLRVGGRTFTKGAKSIIRNSVNGIPLIGDLIALLLDVFVFGEPVGRAAFMAVGSIIGGIIGGVAGLLGGPVMAMIGGLVGSISGDLLGAAFYDLIFRKGNINVADRFGNAITRGGFKAGVAGALSTGGFANFGRYLLGEEGREFVLDADSTAALENNYPGLLMALNKSDGAGAIELLKEYASYENEGRVSFVPIPIPSVSKPNETIVVLDPKGMVTSKRSYSEHYRRG